MHPGKQPHVFNGCFGDQPLSTVSVMTSVLDANGQIILDQILCGRIEDHLHILRHTSSATFSGMTNPNIFDEELVEVRLSLFQWEVHHRSGIAIAANEKAELADGGACWAIAVCGWQTVITVMVKSAIVEINVRRLMSGSR